MTTKTAVEDFLAQKRIAVVGISRNGKKFGNIAFKELKSKGYQVVPINPYADVIEGESCYPSLSALPEPVDGVLVVVPPNQTEKIVREAVDGGFHRIWMQQGAESQAAIQYCDEQGVSLVYNECILMFAEPAGLHHRMHRWVWGVLGKLPQ